MIWKAYKYIYYWLYTWQKKLWGKNDLPEYNAVFGISMSLGLLILSIDTLFFLLTGFFTIPRDLPKINYLPFMGILFFVHYFLFIHKNTYKQIEKEFKKESQAERKRKGFWVLLYTFGTMALYGFLGFLGIWLRNNGYTPLIKYFL